MSTGERPGPGVGAAAILRRMSARLGRGCEDGLGLVEVCMTIAIMGVALVPMMLSVGTATKTSDYIAQRSAAEGYVRRVAELVRSQTTVPQVCPATGSLVETYDTNLHNVLDGDGSDFNFTVARVTVTYTPAASSVDPSGWDAACHADRAIPNLTWVEVTVTSKADSSVTASASTVQRKKVVT